MTAKRENTELEKLALWVVIAALAGPGVLAVVAIVALFAVGFVRGMFGL